VNIDIVSQLCALRYDGHFQAGKVDQRCDLDIGSDRDFCRRHLPKSEAAEERHLDRAAAVDSRGQSVGSGLPHHGPRQVGRSLH
jgi:hypothetical protein